MMMEETRDDLYDLMDLLNKIFSMGVFRDQDRLNGVRDGIMAGMEGSKKSELEKEVSKDDGHIVRSIGYILYKMRKIRRKEAMADFLKTIDIKPYPQKVSLQDMRGRALEELMLRSGLVLDVEEEGKKPKRKTSKKSSSDTNKKDFMDMWLDFYQKSKEKGNG